MNYNITPLTISVHPSGENPVFSERATHISIEDLAGGPFLTISQSRDDTENGKILLEFDEFEAIVDAVKLLKDGMDPEDFK